MYASVTPRLFEAVTRHVRVKVKMVKPRSSRKPTKKKSMPEKEKRRPKKEKAKPRKEKAKPRKEKVKPKKEEKQPRKEKIKPKKEKKAFEKQESKARRTNCPHLHPDKTCARMIEEGLDGGVSDFDIKHFCDGGPILCYYFRLPAPK